MRHRVTLEEIDAATAPQFEHELAQAVRNARNDGGVLDLDFSAVTFMDSTGIAALIAANQDLGGPGRLRIRNAPPAIRRVLGVLAMTDFLADDDS